MRRWDAETVDLIYLDPPFNSDADYNVLYSSIGVPDAQRRAYSDTWYWCDEASDRVDEIMACLDAPGHKAITGFAAILGDSGMLAYLSYMAQRLGECHRLLKPEANLFLHCDRHAGHYLKVLLDDIFGAGCLRNEIVWCYPPKGQPPNKAFHRKHDTIFYYNKSKDHQAGVFHRPYTKLTKAAIAKFSLEDADGRKYKDYKGRRTYLDESEGRPVPSWWHDIGTAGQSRTEYLHYETQKPEKLLARIIEAASNPGDMVLDPFCGCGTTVHEARRLDRRWTGIDISSLAVDVMLAQKLQDNTIPVYGIPYDLRSAERMARTEPFQFETWAIERLRFRPNERQVGEGGIDGEAYLVNKPDDWPTKLAVAQVTGSAKPPVGKLRDFCYATERRRAAVGCYVTLHPLNTRTDHNLTPRSIHISGAPYRRMNLWSIADYFDDRHPQLPQLRNPYTGKPMAQGSLF